MSSDLFTFVEPSVEAHPDRVALVTPDGQAVTYEKLRQTIESFTSKAVASGLSRGDRVTIEIDNYAVQLCLMIALSRLGVVSVVGAPADSLLASGVEVDAVISIGLRLETHPRTIPFNQTWFSGADLDEASALSTVHSQSDDIVLIAASSGTTGRKRFMRFSTAMFAARMLKYDQQMGSEHNKRLITMGVETVIGFSHMLRTFSNGGTVVRPAGTPRETLDLVNTHGLTEIITIPNLIVDLAECQKRAPVALPSLKQVVIAGSAISPRRAREVQTLLCPNVMIAYGATEVGAVATGTIDMIGDVVGGVGTVSPWVEVEAVDEAGKVLPAGETGRLKFRVPPELSVEGYLSTEEADPQTFEGGWFFPGDVGHLTEDRLLVVTGRTTDLINVGGNKISPRIIEEIALTMQGVTAAGAVGLTNDAGFEDVCVAVIADGSIQASDVRSVLVEELGTNTPLRVALVAELPFNMGGKLDRAQLRRHFRDVVAEPS